MQFSYTLTGTLHAPEGTTLSEHGSGIILPSGKEIKLWEQLEICTIGGDDHRDLTSIEAEELGLFYDGDMCDFEELEA